MVGDVDLAGVATKARALTPVPGGVGPVTDVFLMRNTAAATARAPARVRIWWHGIWTAPTGGRSGWIG